MPKIINTSHTSDTVGLPFLARSVEWLQEKTDEQDVAIIQSLSAITPPNEVYQLLFLNIRNTSGTTWAWDAGIILYDNKIYSISSGTVTLGVGESLVYYFITTAQSGEPTRYTDATDFQTNENIKIGICKNTENVSQQIQAVVLTRYMNLEISGSSGDLNFALVKRGNVWNLRVNGSTTGSNITLLKNYNGNTYNSDYTPPLIFNFGYYEFADTVEFGRGSLHKNANNDLILNLGINLGTRVDFTVSWVQ